MDKQQIVDELTEDQLGLVAGGLIWHGYKDGETSWDITDGYGGSKV